MLPYSADAGSPSGSCRVATCSATVVASFTRVATPLDTEEEMIQPKPEIVDLTARPPGSLKTTTSRLLLGVSRPFGVSHELNEMTKDAIVKNFHNLKKGR